MGDLVTLSELARRLGCSKQYIHKLKLQGVLKFDGEDLIDEDVARQAMGDASDPTKAYMKEVNQAQRERWANGPPPERAQSEEGETRQSGNISYMKAKTMREAFNAKIAELEYKERKGELRDSQSVRKTITDAAVLIRSALERIPDKLANRVAAESDPDVCYTMLTEEVDQSLAELAALCERMAEGKT
jgi:phage gp36-like protein